MTSSPPSVSPELRALAAAALRGTSRAEVPKPSPSPLGEVLTRVNAATPEATLLARAAIAGLHARAGVTLGQAQTPPPATLPPPAHPLPEQLWPLVRRLNETSAGAAILSDIQRRGWTLTAVQALTLAQKSASPSDLWPLLDERGKAVLDAHPLHRAWEKAEAEAQWQARLDEVREARQTDPTAGTAQTFDLWKETNADGRRDLLDILEQGILPKDLPLLQHAEKDRSAEVQRRARMLQGHLAGPLQNELLTLLPQVVVKKGDKLSFKPFDLPAALGTAKANAYDDSDLHRLLGALPFSTLLKVLDVRGEQLVQAAEKKHWHLGNQLQEQRRREQPEQKPKAPPVLTTQDAAQWLVSIQQKGQRDQTAFERFAQHLDPAAEIDAPEPLAFVLPPRPKDSHYPPAAWEERQRYLYQERQAQAEAAWRELTDTLRLRREWAAALEEV